MKREFAMLMKAHLEEKGDLPLGGRRMTRSQNMVSPRKENEVCVDKVGGKVKGGESKRTKKDVGEGKLEVVGTNMEVEVSSKAEPVAVEEVVNGLAEDLVQPSCPESLLPQVAANDLDSEGQNRPSIRGAVDSGRERIEDATNKSEKPVKRFTRSSLRDVEIELELGVEKVESGGSLTCTSSPSKLEMKMSKKVGLAKLPNKLKDLLQTGLLEGLRVRYIRGTKSRPRPESELRGVLQGVGILCSCGECKGEKIVTPEQFELHAESGNTSPPDYIYLENGKSLRDVLNVCRGVHSESLEVSILSAIGRSESVATAFCLNCKGLIPENGAGRPMLSCDLCISSKKSDPSTAQAILTSAGSPMAESPTQVGYPSQVKAGKSAQDSSNNRSRMKLQGKLTKKDLGMHKVVFTEDVLPDGAELRYVVQGEHRLEGYKKDGAIFCKCCKSVVSPSQFEAHAGFASRRKPYDNIFTSNGVSLHKLSLEWSKNHKSDVKENDDLCSICQDGGNLLCCDRCPRAFHAECVGVSSIPQETWYCRYCQHMFERSKLEERSANAIAAGRVPGVDALEEIARRCIRIVETSQPDIGGCAVCSGHDFTKKVFDERTVIICDQCEREYHVGCLREREMADLKALPEGDWFCCQQCSNINFTLCNLVEEGEKELPVALTNIVKKKSGGKVLEPSNELDIKWRILKGRGAPEATRKSLSDAVSIFHNRFDPIADSTTAKLDLIPHLVYGRLFKGQDYRGMHCAILIVNSVVVSAAIFRVFGEEVAEIPLVATSKECQGKGYFQCLFSCIENLLASLNVKNLVLPAADEAESLWTGRFGFKKLDEEKVHQYKKHHQHMMIFQETAILHKPIPKSEI